MYTTLINLYGGPCSGKSTAAAYLFAKMKYLGLNVELVTEEAKDAVWEENQCRLESQEYLFGAQALKLARLRGKVDYIITDSPLPMQLYYNKQLPEEKRIPHEAFKELIFSTMDQYRCFDVWLERGDWYEPTGRTQESSAEADQVGYDIQCEVEAFFQGYGWYFDKILTEAGSDRFEWLRNLAELFFLEGKKLGLVV